MSKNARDCKQGKRGIAGKALQPYHSFSHSVPVNAVAAAALMVIQHDPLDRLLARIPTSLDELRTTKTPSCESCR